MQKLDLPYQEVGIQWLCKKPARYLADDMGLGKSRQVIKAINKLDLKRVLIVCPAIARLTWLKEFEKWSDQKYSFSLMQERKHVPGQLTNIVICSFNYAVQPEDKVLKKQTKKSTPPLNPHLKGQWDLIVVDEGHFLKSVDARRTQAILSKVGLIHMTKRAWILSGTPMPNSRPDELWSVMTAFGVTKLNYNAFSRTYCDGYEDGYKFKSTGLKKSKAEEVREMLSRFMLRRLKKDVLKDLPPVMYGDIYVEGKISKLPNLTEEQKAFLSSFSATDPKSQIALLEMSAASISTLRLLCGLQKVEEVAELIDEELKNNAYRKIIIFGIHKEVLNQIVKSLAHHNPVLVNGEVGPNERQRRVEAFQTDPNTRVFAGNIAAAGTNITLTAASQVFFVEEDFVPGNNRQAVDRANRIGQSAGSVYVRRAKLENSIDQKINEILYRKNSDDSLLMDAIEPQTPAAQVVG